MGHKSKRKNPSTITRNEQRRRELAYRLEQSKTDEHLNGTNRANKKAKPSMKNLWK